MIAIAIQILRYWPYILIGLLTLTVGYYKMSNDKLEAKYEEKVAEFNLAQNRFNTLETDTELCNSKVEELSRKGVELNTKLEMANSSIEKLEDRNQRAIRSIQSKQIPKNCPEAVSFLVKSIKTQAKDWAEEGE